MKILYVTTVADTVNAFLIPHIEMLIKKGYSVDIACNVNKPISDKLVKMGCHIFDLPFSRSPLNRSNLVATNQLRTIIRENDYNVVHTHTPNASVCSRLACRKMRKKGLKVIYTAHGFHFYKGASLKNWILYYPIEKLFAHLTDVLITINSEDYARAKNKFRIDKIYHVPGVGVDVSHFSNSVVDKDAVRSSLRIPNNATIILSIGELNQGKNHSLLLEALSQLKDTNLYYLVCGVGHLKEHLVRQSDKYAISERVLFLGFRKDIPDLLHASNLFAFPSKREGLPVALMEAMAAGLPVICSDIRGNRDLVDNEQGGYLLPIDNSGAWARAITLLRDNQIIAHQMGDFNARRVIDYGIHNALKSVAQIYDEIFHDA